ncbi:MAG: 6-phosphogluconolactonase [Solirubrobacterales bacterium]|nr:6-phosphogluconolactonase [Solirubrobacterales bacterium]
MTIEIEVVEDPARACSALLLGVVAGGGNVVLTGGSTPRDSYAQLARAIREVGVDVRNTTFWFGDERCVEPQDDRSNYGMVRDSLLEPLGDSAPREVKRMKGELGPQEGAADYERQLLDAGAPRFDLLMLGIGPDGHTASMFPNQAAVQEESRLVVGVEQAGLEPYVPRVTMTFPAIGLAEHIVVLAAGDSKAEPIAAAFGNDATPTPHVPSSFIPTVAKRLTVLIDPPAAAKL